MIDVFRKDIIQKTHTIVQNTRFEKEKTIIIEMAVSNGYPKNLLDNIRKKMQSLSKNDSLIFRKENGESKFISVPYNYYTKPSILVLLRMY